MLGRAGKAALKLILAAVLTIAILGFVMIPSQTELLFPTNSVPPAGPLPKGAKQLSLVTPDGEQLRGVYIRPSVEDQAPRTLILGFGGNAWNAQHVAEYLAKLYPGAHVIAYHYRGYRPSTGTPSADALVEDAPLIFDEGVGGVKPEKVIAVGFSIGTGVAANLSRQRKLDGLILVTPFDSLKRVAAQLFPWLPVGVFFQHELAAAEELNGGSVPVAIIAAERDEIIPAERSAALRAAVPKLVFDRTIPGAGHNDIYERADFKASLSEALAAVLADQKPV